MVIHRLIITLITFTLAGCVPFGQTILLKDGKPGSQREYDIDSHRCQREAYATFPVVNKPAPRKDNMSCIAINNTINCNAVDSRSDWEKINDAWTPDDINQNKRDEYIQRCLSISGWQRAYLEDGQKDTSKADVSSRSLAEGRYKTAGVPIKVPFAFLDREKIKERFGNDFLNDDKFISHIRRVQEGAGIGIMLSKVYYSSKDIDITSHIINTYINGNTGAGVNELPLSESYKIGFINTAIIKDRRGRGNIMEFAKNNKIDIIFDEVVYFGKDVDITGDVISGRELLRPEIIHKARNSVACIDTERVVSNLRSKYGWSQSVIIEKANRELPKALVDGNYSAIIQEYFTCNSKLDITDVIIKSVK